MEAIRWCFLFGGAGFCTWLWFLQPPGRGLAAEVRLVARGFALVWAPLCWILARECKEDGA